MNRREADLKKMMISLSKFPLIEMQKRQHTIRVLAKVCPLNLVRVAFRLLLADRRDLTVCKEIVFENKYGDRLVHIIKLISFFVS